MATKQLAAHYMKNILVCQDVHLYLKYTSGSLKFYSTFHVLFLAFNNCKNKITVKYLLYLYFLNMELIMNLTIQKRL
jgi:hypothetical protein